MAIRFDDELNQLGDLSAYTACELAASSLLAVTSLFSAAFFCCTLAHFLDDKRAVPTSNDYMHICRSYAS